MVQLFVWNDTYKTGDELIDTQHKKLFEVTNEFYDSMSLGRGKEIQAQVMAELVHYAIQHFKSEEALLAEINYPDLAAHKRQHMEFTTRLRELLLSIEKGDTINSNGVLRLMQTWISDHVLVTDMKYVPYVKAKKDPNVKNNEPQ